MPYKQSAVKLRHQFKRIEKMETSREPNCDGLEIVLKMSGDRPTQALISFTKDGKQVALAPINNSDLKRIKRDLDFFKKAKSGSAQSLHEQHR